MSCIIIALINVLYLHGLKGFADVGWAAKRGTSFFGLPVDTMWVFIGGSKTRLGLLRLTAQPTSVKSRRQFALRSASVSTRRGAKYCDEYVCMSVCLSVRLITRKPCGGLHQFCASCLYRRGSIFLWLVAIAYVMYFRFCG